MANLGGGFADIGIPCKIVSTLPSVSTFSQKHDVKMDEKDGQPYSGLWFPGPGWTVEARREEMQTLRRKQAVSTALKNVLFIKQRGVHSGFLIPGVILDLLYCTIKIEVIVE